MLVIYQQNLLSDIRRNNMAVIHTDMIPTGKIKALHGVGQPPFQGVNFSMLQYLKAFSCPFSRLHDVQGVYGGGRWVDIPNLFRDFDADPEDPASYDFTFTDLLMKALVENGVEPFFRLGVTIENQCTIKSYRIDPPKDPLQWAKICEGVIRHYNEGWADGYHMNIRYWEIWNEPDNSHIQRENMMWNGTMEQYLELYGTASRYLKERFPDIRIGGFASCGFYGILGDRNDPKQARNVYYLDFADAFLEYVKNHNLPLDFFSWHSYGSIEETVKFAAYARERLDAYGFDDVEHSLNEWNCQPKARGTLKHAALTAGMMLALQNTSLDTAMFYDARFGTSIYGGMFNPLTAKPFPAYYGFVAFEELYKRKIQTDLGFDIPGVYGIAAGTKEDGCIVLSNTGTEPVPLECELPAGVKIMGCRIITEGKIWEEIPSADVLPGESVLCMWLGSEK
ncbi:MAG: hypothetical protein E7631_03885 [Ruminococcaceae bacterium]|nr:hypothetical protein [Oscillospiraceae bacterium]